MLNISEKSIGTLQDVSHHLSETSNIDEFRSEAVKCLSDYFSASTAAFFHWVRAGGMPDRLKREDIYFWQLDSQYQEIYFKNIFENDPIRKWYRRFLICPRVATLSSITSPEELRVTSLYKEILCPNKQHDVMTICLVIENKLLGHISLTRPRNSPDFGCEDIQLAQLFSTTLSPAYSRLLLTQKFLNLNDVIDSFTRLYCGGICLILNGSLELVHTSGNYRAYLDQFDISNSRLLESLKMKLNHSARKNPDYFSDSLRIRCWNAGLIQCVIENQHGRKLKYKFIHHVIEHDERLFHILSFCPGYNVTDVKELTNCYGLTKRELQILDKISEGLNSTEIGEQLSISRWTVKNHLQSIYGKVGVNNRISLLSEVAPFTRKIIS